ncbi:VWA domain-containing protein [Rosistilla oblonga]|uniref:von Willebrand factor type A domain protein n=1 Tax=Rosistilla oblonga TaxID=2527990 RepID=A0A518IQV8_9BACT|nr:VWA domain-containing protein [Rosistilla oblonga]QDV55443.1 von Willebrand factor type A domain protein [Rosistilla oblonga]
MLSDFRFANPEWSAAIWIVLAAVAVLLWLDQRRGDVLSRMLSPTMQSRLVRRPSLLRRWASIGCLGLAGLSVVVALMRPQWGLHYVETPRVGAQVMVCLDVSKSMLAEDTAPNRLERAKAELADLLTYLDGDQVGLIAFAGRASVLCPLTPDFGFFKLILEGAGPNSVGRGGTRLEEPIRKAIEGFRSESDVSRLLILITDGEDHDSHPLDAAKAAAERGIKILAIGIGDEAGSEIRITDPKTGVQQTVRDANGDAVVTRLDGQTLRDMALATQGAYIPAGTGVLNLRSIYDAHIAPLVRGQLDDRGRAVRNEAFQWALLSALIFLLAGTVLAGGSAAASQALDLPSLPAGQKAAAAIALLVVGACMAVPASAAEETQSADDQAVVAPQSADGSAVEAVEASSDSDGEAEDSLEDRDPRSLYNEGIEKIKSDFDGAERLLVAARRGAGIDGELRFRATYNMGWVEIGRADELLEEKPAESLRHLESAADWFRMAIGLRDDDMQARHNLEVVLRRILELRDSLANQDDRDVTQRIDALIEAQRAVVGSAVALVQRVSAIDDPNATDAFRNEFRQLAVEQRKQLADAQSLTEVAREELDVIDGKPEADRTDEQKLRAAQLNNVLHYVNRANQRMGGARSQMRLRQAERAFRRSASALEELKRARDQLRQPVEVLDQILADATTAAQGTALLAADGERGSAKSPLPEASPTTPAWLNQEYLRERQQSVSERTTELYQRLKAGADQHAAAPQDQAPAADDETAAFMESLREALPSLEAGDRAMEQAVKDLDVPDYRAALDQQRQGIESLSDARERFLDLRGLIELTYATQTQISAMLDPSAGLPEPPEDLTEEPPALTEDDIAQRQSLVEPLQTRNRTRLDRLSELITKQQQTLSAAANADPATPPADDAPDPAAELQRFELAADLAGKAKGEMTKVLETLAKVTAEEAEVPAAEPKQEAKETEEPAEPKEEPKEADESKGATETKETAEPSESESEDVEKEADKEAEAEKPEPKKTELKEAESEDPEKADADEAAMEPQPAASEPFALPSGHAQAAVEHLEALRRLFFSVVEHLREAAMQQAQLNDETQQVAGLQDDPAAMRQLGPISLEQAELSNKAQQIADALNKQAEQSPESPAGHQLSPQQTEEFEQAGQRYREAAGLVTAGMQSMQSVGDALTEADPQVEAAREHQDEALTKLVEALQLLQPPQSDPNDQPQDSGEDQQEQQPQESDQGEQPQMDSSSFLQAVRDREAQRRRDQERSRRLTREPVAKDW